MIRLIKHKAPDDSILLNRFVKQGDISAFGELYKKHAPFILAVCMKYFKDREKSKDAVMGIFEKLNIDLKRFEIQNLKAWLHTYTRNYCLQILRIKSIEITESKINAETSRTPFMESRTVLHHDDEDEKEEKLLHLEDAITKLKTEQRKCIELFYLKEKSYAEICTETGFSFKEVKSYLQNGKRNLKIMMESNDEAI